jgi:hypothetical protein
VGKITKKTAGIVGIVLAGILVLTGGVAYAVSTFFAGTVTSVQRDITETNAFFVPVAVGWHDVPSTGMNITIPVGTTRIVESTFGAESRCVNTSWCSVRVIAVSAGGVTELNPMVGTNFAFDSPGGNFEQHSMHRVTRLGAGSYFIKVQAQLVGPAVGAEFWLDDYTHFVDLVNP